jgi:integrase
MPRRLITARFVKRNSVWVWRVGTPISLGGGAQYFGDDKAAADRRAREVNKLLAQGPSVILGLSHNEQAAILLARRELGDGPPERWLEAVKFWKSKQGHKTKSLAEVVGECVKAKQDAGCREWYMGPFTNMLRRFSEHCGDVQMADVTLAQVATFINAPKLKAVWEGKKKSYVEAGPSAMKTRENRRIDLGTLFSYAVKHGYCTENLPLKTEEIRKDDREPGILKVEEAKLLMDTLLADPELRHLVPYAALGLFGGLRPSEAQRLTWGDIKEEIRVAADRGKKRSNRFVTINDTLLAWLKPVWELAGSLPIPETTSRRVRQVLKGLKNKDGTPACPGFVWPKDGLRHSFSSYHLKIHGGRITAAEAGHSEDMMHSTYKQLVTTAQAEAFWLLRPSVSDRI